MISAAHTSEDPSVHLLPDLVRVVRRHLRRRSRRGAPAEPVDGDRAVVRALCHDMHGSLAFLESALRRLDDDQPQRADLLTLARVQAAHLSSLLRTVEATGSGQARGGPGGRTLHDVVVASTAASGLPDRQLTVRIDEPAGRVPVGDARLQRILLNLLENAHRHGGAAPVLLHVSAPAGWVRIVVRQAGVPSAQVVGHLSREHPPDGLTGLGLWSVRRQTAELGGRILWDDGGGALTLVVELPDR